MNLVISLRLYSCNYNPDQSTFAKNLGGRGIMVNSPSDSAPAHHPRQSHASLSFERRPSKRSNDSRPSLASLSHYLLGPSFHYFVSSLFLHRRNQLRNLERDHHSLPRPALNVQMQIRPVHHAPLRAHVAQPDSF